MSVLQCTIEPSMAPAAPQPTFDLALTPKEIHRLVFALDHTIDSFGDVLPGEEVARYEDLSYRLHGLTDDRIGSLHVEGRRHDRA